MFKKLRIIAALTKWLFLESHPNGLKFTINRIPAKPEWEGLLSAKTWFMVEPAIVWISYEEFKDQPNSSLVRDTNNQLYVRIGGGAQHGKLLAISDLYQETVDQEPNI